jgi:hypothetical protein
VNEVPVDGRIIVQTSSVGWSWSRQTSSVAAVSDWMEQFWLSQVTVILVEELSGMRVPLGDGWAAHKLPESQITEIDGPGLPPPLPPPPQPAKKVVKAISAVIPESERMPCSVIGVQDTSIVYPLPNSGPSWALTGRSAFCLAIMLLSARCPLRAV